VVLATEGLALRPEPLDVDDCHRPPARGVARTAPRIVRLLPCLGVARIAGVQRAIRAADDVDEVHAAIIGEQRAARKGSVAASNLTVKLMAIYAVAARVGSTHSCVEGAASAGVTRGPSAVSVGRVPGLPHDDPSESSVRTEDNRLRVTATLVRVRDQVQVWSQSYDREPTSVLSLQRELSTAIAEQIRLRLSPGHLEALARRQTQRPDAYDLYLRGRNFENQRTPATNRRAVEYYTRATEVDPDYALAWSAIARVLAASLINGDAFPSDVLPRAREAAMRAVRAAPNSAETQFALAYVQWCCEWDWPASEAGFRRALTLDPRFAQAHLSLGHALSQMGRHQEAAQSTRVARDLEPLSPFMPALSSQVAFQARNYRAALDYARQAIVLDPEFWIGHMMRGQALERLGEYAPALEALTTAARFSGENSKALSMRAYVLARTGRRDEARAMLQTLEEVSKSRYVPPYAMSLIGLGLEERESVFACWSAPSMRATCT
jgi:tetratricopeptide (TPR) repeat protein